jgi:hypothetical protein
MEWIDPDPIPTEFFFTLKSTDVCKSIIFSRMDFFYRSKFEQ